MDDTELASWCTVVAGVIGYCKRLCDANCGPFMNEWLSTASGTRRLHISAQSHRPSRRFYSVHRRAHTTQPGPYPGMTVHGLYTRINLGGILNAVYFGMSAPRKKTRAAPIMTQRYHDDAMDEKVQPTQHVYENLGSSSY